MPIVLQGDKESFAFIKNDAGGVPIPEHKEIAPTIRSDARTAITIKDEAPKAHAIVRRLLPLECERLQGMPDHYTRISWKGKSEDECPDAPRYKALGNSMAINVMAWVGERIQHEEDLINDRQRT